MASHMANLFMNKQLRNYKVLNSTIIDSQKVTNMTTLQLILLSKSSKSCISRLSDMFTQLEAGLECMASYTLKHMMSPKDQHSAVHAIEKIIESVSISSQL